jgi:trimethylamine--corrinoid protein Co-methyltransferase
VAQVNAEALAGVAFTQLIRKGCAADLRPVHGDRRHEDRRPHGRHAGSRADDVCDGCAGAPYKLPWRTSGFHVGSKLNDAQAGYEANMLMHAAILSGANYIWHVAGWLEAGLTCGYSKFVTDCRTACRLVQICRRPAFDDFKDAMAAVREVGPQGTSSAPSTRSSISRRPSSCPRSWTFNSFEQWSAEGAKDHDTRGRDKARAPSTEFRPRTSTGTERREQPAYNDRARRVASAISDL